MKGSNFAEALETVWRTGESLSRRTASVSEGAVVLAKASLSRNRLGEVGGKAVGEALRVNTVLKTLYLSGNRLGEVGRKAVSGAHSVNTVLKILTMDD